MFDGYYTTTEIQNILGTTRPTIESWVRTGLPYQYLHRHLRLISLDALETFLSERNNYKKTKKWLEKIKNFKENKLKTT